MLARHNVGKTLSGDQLNVGRIERSVCTLLPNCRQGLFLQLLRIASAKAVREGGYFIHIVVRLSH